MLLKWTAYTVTVFTPFVFCLMWTEQTIYRRASYPQMSRCWKKSKECEKRKYVGVLIKQVGWQNARLAVVDPSARSDRHRACWRAHLFWRWKSVQHLSTLRSLSNSTSVTDQSVVLWRKIFISLCFALLQYKSSTTPQSRSVPWLLYVDS